uniref:Transmembrane protein n=1 Tax=Solanum lycopersicum TaxID=4081 RepID=A0A3Q7GK57_SOLLC
MEENRERGEWRGDAASLVHCLAPIHQNFEPLVGVTRSSKRKRKRRWGFSIDLAVCGDAMVMCFLVVLGGLKGHFRWLLSCKTMLKFMVIVFVIHWFEMWWQFGVILAEVLAWVLIGKEKKSPKGVWWYGCVDGEKNRQ